MASDQVKEAIAEVKEHNNSVEARPKMNPEESSWFHVFLGFFSAFFSSKFIKFHDVQAWIRLTVIERMVSFASFMKYS